MQAIDSYLGFLRWYGGVREGLIDTDIASLRHLVQEMLLCVHVKQYMYMYIYYMYVSYLGILMMTMPTKPPEP